MYIIQQTASWITFNSFLAIMPVIFIILFAASKNRLWRIFWGGLWLLYLPNTVYVITDITHLIHDWRGLSLLEKAVTLPQYAVLESVGLCAFILALYPVERKFEAHFKDIRMRTKIELVVLLNFLIGFGIVLGRVERINSWDVFVSPMNVLQAVYNTLFTWELLLLTLLFGLFANSFYFLFRKPIYAYFEKALKRIDRV